MVFNGVVDDRNVNRIVLACAGSSAPSRYDAFISIFLYDIVGKRRGNAVIRSRNVPTKNNNALGYTSPQGVGIEQGRDRITSRIAGSVCVPEYLHAPNVILERVICDRRTHRLSRAYSTDDVNAASTVSKESVAIDYSTGHGQNARRRRRCFNPYAIIRKILDG